MKKVRKESLSDKMGRLDELSERKSSEIKGGVDPVFYAKPSIVSVTRFDRVVSGPGITTGIKF